MADKQTCHVTHAHWCVRDPRSGARARLPVSFFDAKKKETRKDDHGKGTRRVLFFSDLFLSASSSSLDALKRSISKVVHRDKNAIVSSFQHRAAQSRIRMHARCSKKGGGREKRTRRRKRRSANKNAPSGDVSLRRGHADGLGGSSLGQGEHFRWCCVVCVYLKVRTTRVL